eukprot:403342997
MQVNSHKIKVISKIGEGAYGYVYKVQRIGDNQLMALKVMNIGRDSINAQIALQAESLTLSKICPHPNIVNLIDRQEVVLKDLNNKQVLLLLEYCSGGNLYNLIEERSKQGLEGLNEIEILDILNDLVNGIIHMHLKEPAIAHRDLKNRELINEDIDRSSTPIYRAPEQLDLYSGFKITEKVDIWALGTILYTLMYFKSPFQPGEKLAQINANYKIPQNIIYSKGLIQLLKQMLTKDPEQRINIGEIWSTVDNLKEHIQYQTNTIPMVLNTLNTNEKELQRQIHTDNQVLHQSPPIQQIYSPPQQINQNQLSLQRPSSTKNQTISPQLFQEQNNVLNFQHLQLPQQNKQIQPNSQISSPKSSPQIQDSMQTLVSKLINQNETAISEKDLRHLIVLLHSNQQNEITFYRYLALQDFKTITTVALKSLAVAHRLQLYYPSITHKSLISLFGKLNQSWQNIFKNKVKSQLDKYRCEYFATLILQYSDYLGKKSQMINEYSDFVDGSFSLNKYFNQKTEKSPLNIDFIQKLDKLWATLNSISRKIFRDSKYLYELRLNILVSVFEDIYLITCLITHLIFAIKIVCQRYNTNVPQNFKQFITQIEANFEINYKEYTKLQNQFKGVQELQHLKIKLPQLPLNLHQELKNSNLGSLNRNVNMQNQFILSDYLNQKKSLLGLQIPMPFKVFADYEHKCHDYYELLIGTQIYRQNIGNYYDKKDPISNHIVDEMLQNRQRFTSNRSSYSKRANSLSSQGSHQIMNIEKKNQLSNQLWGGMQREFQSNIRQDSVVSNEERVLDDSDITYLQQNIFGQIPSQNDNLINFDHQFNKQDDLIQQLQGLKIEEHKNTDHNNQNEFNMNWALNSIKHPETKNQTINNSKSQKPIIAMHNIPQNNSDQMNTNSKQQQNQQDYQDPDYFLLLNQKYAEEIKEPSDNQSNNIFLELQQYNSPQQSQHSGYSDYQNMQNQFQLLDQQYSEMRKQQSKEIRRQTEIINKMRQDQDKEENINRQEQQLEYMKSQFTQEKSQLIKQKKILENEMQKFNYEKIAFEEQKRDQEDKIAKAKLQLLEEKRKIEVMQQQLAEQNKLQSMQFQQFQQESQQQQIANKAQHQQLKQEMIKIQEEQSKLNIMKQEEQKVASQLQLKKSGSNQNSLAGQILEEEFQKGQEFFILKLSELKVEKQIGAGASAEVYKGTYKETDVAIKKLRNLQSTNENTLKEFKREVSTLTRVRHPNLVLFMGASAEKGHVLIVTEFCYGGTLFTLLHEKLSIKLSWKQRYTMALDIAKGMHFLHSQEPHILHRDLKSLNLLMTQPVTKDSDYVQVKITDFGLSRDDHTEIMTGQAGTFHWMAPETLENKPYTHKADVYSYGIVLWEIICREPPFKTYQAHEIIYKVVNFQERPSLTKIPSDCPKELITIMTRCWDQQPTKRPDFADIVRVLKQVSIQN